jgi:hypothetical protein
MIVQRVGVWSVARLYGAIGVCIGAFAGVLFALAAALGSLAGSGADRVFGGAVGVLVAVGGLIVLPIFYGVISLNRQFFEKKADA